jgi:outer membrane lipoprotein SlyB
MLAGATAGGMFGLYYGYTRKKNLAVMTIAGGVIGALVSRLLTPSA